MKAVVGRIGVSLTLLALIATAYPRPQVEQQINALLARMTLEEKLGQLQQARREANGNYGPNIGADSQRSARLNAERARRAAHQ